MIRLFPAAILTIVIALIGLPLGSCLCAQDPATQKPAAQKPAAEGPVDAAVLEKALASARARLINIGEQGATLRRLAAGERLQLIKRMAGERSKLRDAERATEALEQRAADLAREDRTQRAEAEARDRRDRGIEATVRRGLETTLRAERHSLVSLEHPELRDRIQQRLHAIEAASRPIRREELAHAFTDLRTYLHESRRIAWFEAEAADARGQLVKVQVCRLGQAAAYYRHGDEYGHLQLTPGGHWKLLAVRDPAAVAGLFADRSAEFVAPIDPSGGLALAHDAEHAGLLDHLQAGGPVMIPLGLLVLVAFYLVLERLWFLARARRNVRRLSEVLPELSAGASEAAIRDRLLAAPGPMAQAIQTALRHPAGGDAAVDQALREATPALERGLGLLGVLGTVAPFLGLLGTVTGLITTFATLTAVGTNDPRLLAGGISEALVTTQTGLILAIPILLVHAYLTGRVDNLTDRLESAAEAATAGRHAADDRQGGGPQVRGAQVRADGEAGA